MPNPVETGESPIRAPETNGSDPAPASPALFKFPEESYQVGYFDSQGNVCPQGSAALVRVYSCLDELVLSQAGDSATDLTLSPELSYEIYADSATIAGRIACPGQSVKIHARLLGVRPDSGGTAAEIDVSATAPPPAPAPPAPKEPQSGVGTDAGDAGMWAMGLEGIPAGVGPTGSTGATGANASGGAADGGSIEILACNIVGSALKLTASGGVGAAGQDGQAGQDGGAGGAGIDGDLEDALVFPGSGGAGGAGGTGGGGGQGGAGGTITVRSIASLTDFDLTLSVPGGAGGAGGRGGDGGAGGSYGHVAGNLAGWSVAPTQSSGGNGGAGGSGGPGGAAGTTSVSSNVVADIRMAFGNPGNGGQGGAAGAQGAVTSWDDVTMPAATVVPAVGAQGQPGEPGGTSVEQQLPAGGYDDFASVAELGPACTMTLNKARLLYMTADAGRNSTAFAQAFTLLNWLLNITSVFASPSPPPGIDPTDAAIRAGIHDEAVGLLHRMVAGRDYFGNLPSHVPLESYASYDAQLSRLLDNFDTVEKSYLAYFSALQQESGVRQTLQVAREGAQQSADSVATRIDTVAETARALLDTINESQTAVEAREVIMTQAIAAVEQALAAQAGAGCTLKSLLAALGTVSALTGDKDVAQAKSIAGALDADYTSVIGSADATLPSAEILQKVDALGASIESIAEGYTTNQGLITESDPNAYKILAAQADFDTALKPFMDVLGEAGQKAVDAVNQYVAEIQLRNRQILQYNSAVGELVALRGEKSRLGQQMTQVDNALAAQSDPELAVMTNFVAGLYHLVREDVVEAIYQASRAYCFSSLDTAYSPFTALGLAEPSQLTSATAQACATELDTKFSDAVAAFGQQSQSFPANAAQTGLTVEVRRSDHPDLFAAFTGGTGSRRLTISVPSAGSATPFGGMADIRLVLARPWVSGCTTSSGILTVKLVHGYDDIMAAPDGSLVSFSHEPLTLLFKFACDKPLDPTSISVDATYQLQEDAPEKGKYALPGPFTDWTLIIDPSLNDGLDMSAADRVVLEFAGMFRASSSAATGA